MDAQNPAQPQNPVSQPTVPSTPEQPSGSKPKSSKWIIAIIAVLILVVAGSAAVYFLNNNLTAKTQKTQTTILTATPTAIPASAANWKTYTNTKYNFSIDYPSDWRLREFPDTQDGASFNPLNMPGYPDVSDSISMNVGKKNGDYIDTAFEDYVKVAANKEIQNYNELASIKKVTTTEGVVGYETTWMVQPITIMGRPPDSGDSESLPITYFEMPSDKTSLLQISLGKNEDLDIYEKMLITLKFTTPIQTPILTATPTVDEKSLLKTVIKEAIVVKHGSDGNSLNVTVSQIDGNYAKGGASDEGGGGMWFAAKVNGVWKLVWDGNGGILCSDLTSYPDFPVSMIPACWNDITQKTIQR